MKLNCQHCQRPLKIPDRLAGREVKCPACQRAFVVPQPAAEPGDNLAGGAAPRVGQTPPVRETPPVGDTTPVGRNESQRDLAAAAAGSAEVHVKRETEHAAASSVVPEAPASSRGIAGRAAKSRQRLVTAVQQSLQLTSELARRVRGESASGIACVRTHYEAIWVRLRSGPLRYWKGEESLTNEFELLIPDRKRIAETWTVDLSNHCVVCGAKATEHEFQQLRMLENFAVPCRALWYLFALVLLLLVWRPVVNSLGLQLVLAPLVCLPLALVALRFRTQEPATVRFHCCAEHAANERYPRLFLVSGGLLVQLGAARARRRLAEKLDGRGPSRSADSSDSRPELEPGGLYAPLPPSAAPQTMALVDDGEPTPIIHSAVTLTFAGDESRTAESLLPGTVESLPPGIAESSPAAVPLAAFPPASIPLESISLAAIPLTAIERDVPFLTEVELRPDESSGVASADPVADAVTDFATDPAAAAVTDRPADTMANPPPTDGAEEILDGILMEDDAPECGAADWGELAALVDPPAESQAVVAGSDWRPAPRGGQTEGDDHQDEESDGSSSDDVSLKQILAAPFQWELVKTGVYVGALYMGSLVLSGIGILALAIMVSISMIQGLEAGDASWPRFAAQVLPWLAPVIGVVLLLRPVCVLCGYYLATAEAYESGENVVSAPRSRFTSLVQTLLVTLISLLPWGGLIGGLALAEGTWDPVQLGAAVRADSGWIVGMCAAAAASLLYWPMGMAVAGAYRSLDPIRVVLAMGRSLPIYALVLAWLVPVAALTGAAAFGLNVLLMETALALPEAWHAWLAVGLPVAAVLISGAVVQYPAVALFAMLGLILKKYRSRLAWEPREINPWIPFALKALVVVGCTAVMIGLISKVPAWLSQLGSAVSQKSHPPFVPWSAAQQTALQQLESRGASVSRTPQTIGRFQQVIETHDARTNTVTRQAMADVTIDLRNSTVGDQDIPLILELRPSSMSGKLQRIHVRASPLTQDGILELRRRLPETVIEE